MMEGPKSFQRLVRALSRLPGVGVKSASRLAIHLLKGQKTLCDELADSIREMKDTVVSCKQCFCYSQGEICDVCLDPSRDASILCVVEEAVDVFSIENSARFKGKYHVLGGRISPINGVGPSDLNLDALVLRVKQNSIKEIIIATNPNVEGDATALYIARMLASHPVKLSRIAMGIPMGASLEYADQLTLGRSILERREFSYK